MFKSDLSDSQFEKLVALQKYLPSDDQPTRQAKHLLVEGFTLNSWLNIQALNLRKSKNYIMSPGIHGVEFPQCLQRNRQR